MDATVATSLAGPPWRIDSTRIVWGGVRFEAREDGLALAGGLGAPIVAATELEQGWLFLTSDGLLALAQEFLGPLEVVDRWDGTASVVQARGRIVIAGEDTVLTSTGGPLEPMRLPHRLEDGAFRGDVGLVLSGWALRETRDGGRSWSQIDLGGTLPLDVALSPEGGFAVMRSDGAYRWRDGSWERAPYPEDPIVSEPERVALLRAVAALPWMRLDHDFLAALDQQARRVQEGCVEALFAGPYTFFRCADGDQRWWERRGGSGVVRIDVVTHDRPSVSSDGLTALWTSPCTTEDLEPACALVGDRLFGVPLGEDARFVTVSEGRALVERGDVESAWDRFRLLDLRSGRATHVRFGSEARRLLDAPTLEPDDAWILDDGRYVVISLHRESSSSSQVVLAAGDPSVGLRARPLPIGASQPAVLADGRLVVFGDGTGNDHWAPREGSFRRIHVGFDGVAGSGDAPICDQTSCRSGSLVVGADTSSEPALLGGGAYIDGIRDPRRPPRVIRLDEISVSRSLECADPFRIAMAEEGEAQSMQAGVRARREVDGTSERWTWQVEGGTRESATGPLTEPARGEWTVVHATSRYALVWGCDERSCALHVLRDGRVEAVPAPPMRPELDSVALEDGGVLVVGRATGHHLELPVHIGWWFDAEGHLSRTRPHLGHLSLARWGSYGWIGTLRGLHHDIALFWGLDGTERRVPAISWERRPCPAAPRRDALLMRDAQNLMLDFGGQRLVARSWLEVEAHRACVRAYDVYPTAPLANWPSRIEARDGRLRAIERGRPRGECSVRDSTP